MKRFYRPRVNPYEILAFVDSVMTAFALSILMIVMAVCVSCITAWMLGEL
jgi:hypothetical protein